eukprot:scaffold47259_cov43-Phaeocystis_antarctica.AAC.1
MGVWRGRRGCNIWYSCNAESRPTRSYRELSEAKVGRERRDSPRHVGTQPAASHEGAHHSRGRRLADVPVSEHRRRPIVTAAAVGPGGRRGQAERGEGCRGRPRARRPQRGRRRQGPGRRRGGALACLEEGHEGAPVAAVEARWHRHLPHVHAHAGTMHTHLRGLVQQVAGVVAALDAERAQRRGHAALDQLLLRLVAAMVDQPRGATLARERDERVRGVTRLQGRCSQRTVQAAATGSGAAASAVRLSAA